MDSKGSRNSVKRPPLMQVSVMLLLPSLLTTCHPFLLQGSMIIPWMSTPLAFSSGISAQALSSSQRHLRGVPAKTISGTTSGEVSTTSPASLSPLAGARWNPRSGRSTAGPHTRFKPPWNPGKTFKSNLSVQAAWFWILRKAFFL